MSHLKYVNKCVRSLKCQLKTYKFIYIRILISSGGRDKIIPGVNMSFFTCVYWMLKRFVEKEILSKRLMSLKIYKQ